MPSIAAFSHQAGDYLQQLGSGRLTRPQQRHLAAYVLALVVSVVRRTFSGQARCFHYGRTASAIKRFLTEAPWDPAALQAEHQARLRAWIATQPPEAPIELLIDDTATHKYGRKMEGLSRHYIDGRIRWGHCKVTLYVRVGVVQVPYDSRLYMTRATCAAEGRPFATKLALAQAMLASFAPPRGRSVCVMFDSFYASRAMVQYVCFTRKWDLLARVEQHRTVRYRGHKRPVRSLVEGRRAYAWQPLRIESHDYEGQQFKVKLWHQIPGSLTASRSPEDPSHVHYLISNRRDWSAASVVRGYQHRWYIETYHRDVKQLLGLAHYQTRRLVGLVRHWLLVDLAYCVLSLQTADTRDPATTPADPPRLTLGQLRQLAQQQAERDRLRTLIAVWQKTHSYQTVFQAAGL